MDCQDHTLHSKDHGSKVNQTIELDITSSFPFFALLGSCIMSTITIPLLYSSVRRIRCYVVVVVVVVVMEYSVLVLVPIYLRLQVAWIVQSRVLYRFSKAIYLFLSIIQRQDLRHRQAHRDLPVARPVVTYPYSQTTPYRITAQPNSKKIKTRIQLYPVKKKKKKERERKSPLGILPPQHPFPPSIASPPFQHRNPLQHLLELRRPLRRRAEPIEMVH